MRKESKQQLEKAKELIDRLPGRMADQIDEIISDPKNHQTIALWTSAMVAAIIAVAYAKLFRIAEEEFRSVLKSEPLYVFIISPVFFLLAWLIVRKYAPEAAGSGIPQIMAANEMDHGKKSTPAVQSLLSLRTAGIKVISSLLCVGGGGAVGREGPTLQICASVFYFFGRQLNRFSPKAYEPVWVVAGAAAGLASAFNTPLGGIVYAIEELGLVQFHKIRTALISGVIASGMVAQLILGSYLYLGLPKLTPVGLSMLPVALLMGAITGIMGAGFGRALVSLLRRRLAITNTKRLALITVGCGVAMAGFAYLDELNSGTGVNVITGFLFDGQEPSLALVATRFFGTMISYLSGAAGGIFAPSLAIGASVGAYLTQFVAAEHANLMVLLGMIGFLTGVTRTPFTSFILVLEMTDRHSAIFPMMLAALTAQSVSHFIDKKSFYEHVKERFLPPDPAKAQPSPAPAVPT